MKMAVLYNVLIAVAVQYITVPKQLMGKQRNEIDHQLEITGLGKKLSTAPYLSFLEVTMSAQNLCRE